MGGEIEIVQRDEYRQSFFSQLTYELNKGDLMSGIQVAGWLIKE